MRSRPLPSSSTTCSRRVHPVTLDPDVIRSRCTRSRSLSPGSVSANATTKPRKHEEKREEEYVFFVLFVDFRVFVVAFRQELEQLATMSREQFLAGRDSQDIACYRLLVTIDAAIAFCYRGWTRLSMDCLPD